MLRSTHGMLFSLFFVFVVLFGGCAAPASPIPPTATPVPPTATAVPPTPTPTRSPLTISGTLLGVDGPMAGAVVTLTSFPGDDCAALGKKAQLSDAEEEQLKSCKIELPTVKADRRGHYAFVAPGSGWYRLSLIWPLSKRPSEMGLMSMHFRDGFFTMLGESKATPGAYIGVGTQEELFEFSGTENVVVDFDYNKPDES